jgi:hypothetical protein
MHLDASVVFDETQFTKAVHEEADPGPGGPDHLGQGYLGDLRDRQLLAEPPIPRRWGARYPKETLRRTQREAEYWRGQTRPSQSDHSGADSANTVG